jgi:hypothetical protein
MANSTLNEFNGSGTSAERLAFTPSPPTPASGPDPGFVFWDTDLQQLFAWDAGLAAWVGAGGGGGGGAINAVLTADPASPADDTWWVVRDGASPQGVALRARIGGVTFTIAEITL